MLLMFDLFIEHGTTYDTHSTKDALVSRSIQIRIYGIGLIIHG